MARKLKAVDAVMVGMGWTGSIMARELTKAGFTVVGLERGSRSTPTEDFALPRHPRRTEIPAAPRADAGHGDRDHHHAQQAVRDRAADARMGSCLPVGDGVGGAGAHWNGVTWRIIPSEFVLRSHWSSATARTPFPRT